jgi:hypothetical protein
MADKPISSGNEQQPGGRPQRHAPRPIRSSQSPCLANVSAETFGMPVLDSRRSPVVDPVSDTWFLVPRPETACASRPGARDRQQRAAGRNVRHLRSTAGRHGDRRRRMSASRKTCPRPSLTRAIGEVRELARGGVPSSRRFGEQTQRAALNIELSIRVLNQPPGVGRPDFPRPDCVPASRARRRSHTAGRCGRRPAVLAASQRPDRADPPEASCESPGPLGRDAPAQRQWSQR